jgi:hypothetical protein
MDNGCDCGSISVGITLLELERLGLRRRVEGYRD